MSFFDQYLSTSRLRYKGGINNISAQATSASTTIHRFISCIEQVDVWMSRNRLKMNADKTQLIWLGRKQQLDKLTTTEQELLLSARVRF